MKTLGLLLVIQLCCLAVQGLFVQDRRDTLAKSKFNRGPPLQPRKNVHGNVVPKYILELYAENLKHGRTLNNLHCIFPKIMQTKRAIKLIFKNNSFNDDKNSKWKGDELRIFMTTAKESITSSKKPYFVKIFDLYSRRMVNIYKFSSKDYGWKTLNISGWRSIKPLQDSRGRFGLKIVVVLSKRKLGIKKTAFRKARSKNKPYFIEFFHEEDTKSDTFKAKGKGLFEIDRHKKKSSVLPAAKTDVAKRDYYLPFQRYVTGRSLD